jgi:transmembrane sensor
MWLESGSMQRPPATPRPALPSSAARREASVWLARLERGLRDDEGTGLRQWMQTLANREAILETANLWHGPEVYRLLLSLAPPDLSKARREVWRRTSRRMFTVLGLTSSAVLCLTLLSGQMPWKWFDEPGPNPRAAPNEYFRTAVGQTRTVSLRDGSLITLNTGTRVEVTYLPERREVFLSQGEASFDVAPDAKRPFYVFAARRQFEAIGTKFNVRAISPVNAELTVTEGEVKVLDAPPKIPASPARRRDPITYGEATVGVSETALVEPGFQLVTGLRRTLRRHFAIFSRPDTRGRVVLMPLPPVPRRTF